MIPAKLQEHLDNLALFPDRSERIEALIAIGDEFRNPTKEEFPRTGDRRVPGCESEAFVSLSAREDGTYDFHFAVDNPQGISAMALAQILAEGLSGAPLDQVMEVSEDVVYTIFGRELSMGKSMGLTGMVRMAKTLAGVA
jgi:cysteine desulfuration protein SufE